MRISDWSSDVCSSDLVLPERPSGAMEDAFRGGDAAGPARRLGIDGDRERTLEQDVALDAHAERQAQGRHFRQAERSQFGLAEIGETEQGVAVLVEFGRQPGRSEERRVGKGLCSTFQSGWVPYPSKNKK